MSAQPGTVRRIGMGLILVTTALVSSACAAGQQAQTANEKPTFDGTQGSVGKIDLRGVAIEAPDQNSWAAGSDVQLDLVIVNNGDSADTLTGITTTAARSWGGFSSTADAQAVVDADSAGATASSSAPSSAPASSASSSSSPSSSSSSSSPAPSSSTSSAAPLPVGATSIAVPAGGAVAFSTPDSDRVLLLQGLTKMLYPAQEVAITFTFQNAGSVTLDVPVALTIDPHAQTISPIPSQSGD